MRWIGIKEIEDLATISYGSFDKVLEAGLIVFYDSNSGINICSAQSFDPNCNRIESGSSDYYLIGGNLCLKFGNEIRKIDLTSCTSTVLCKTDRNNISLINQEYCRGSSSFTKPRRKINDIISIRNAEVIYSWEDNKALISWSAKYPIFFNKESEKLFAFDLSGDKVLWNIILDKGFAGVSYVQEVNDRELFLQRYLQFEEYNLLKIDVITGSIVWEAINTLNHYNYEASSCKLYGIGGKTFEVINAKTGEREIQQELSEDLHISSHLTYYYNGLLYFSGYQDKNIPVFGAVDVENGELVFTQEVEMPGEKSFRKGLDRPVVVGNRLYVRDSMKTLHVYERVEDSL